MKHRENKNWKGQYVVEVKESNGNIRHKQVIDNLITDVALNRQAELIVGNSTTPIKYLALAIGANSTAPQTGDTQLISETFRQPFLNKTYNPANTGQVVFRWVVSFDDITTTPNIKEIGVFATDGISDESDIETLPNLGLMVSRILFGS